MKILKFGGSSVATADRIARVAEIVKTAKADGEVALVVSALGGATDTLGRAATAARVGDVGLVELVAGLENRHLEAVRAVADPSEHDDLETATRELFARLRELLHGVGLVGEVSPRSLDRILACGELLSAPIVAAALRRVGLDAAAVDARGLIVTDAAHGRARPDIEATRTRVLELFDSPSIPVVTGFIGATPTGETTTLGRGGSDFSASILAVAGGASAVELWTDVDGVMSADPRLVPGARAIRRLRYDELMELSHFGAKVVHAPSVHPLRAIGIPVWIKSTFDPDAPGTLVSDAAHDAAAGDSPVRGITSIDRVAMARLEGDGMVGVPGVAMRLFGALARRGVSVILITQGSSEHSICFAVTPEDLDEARQAVEAEFEVDRRAGDIDELTVEDDVAVVAVVGAAMRQCPGIAGRLFSVLGDEGINVRAIAQGSSELNISVVVKERDKAPAVQAIHRAFFDHDPPAASLFLAGVGGVGSALLELLEQHEQAPGRATTLRLEGAADSKSALLDRAGIAPGAARERLKRERQVAEPAALIDAALASASPIRIFVDCTASGDLADAHQRLLDSGVSVVTANKKPLAGGLDRFRRLKLGRGGLYHEATVGAGLPVVRTLDELLSTGDQLMRIEGVLSGTASFLCAELARGETLSGAVAQAGSLGYTEPDPREDLAGEDVARKLLILARMAGAELERGDLEVEGWIPAQPWAALPLAEFQRRLPELDEQFRRRLETATRAGRRLTYLASWDGSGARVRLTEIDPGHPCFGLAAGENLIAFHSRRYAEIPLVVRGPGAGPRVTAAGVYADILRLLRERGARHDATD